MRGKIVRRIEYKDKSSEGVMELEGTEDEIREVYSKEQAKCEMDNRESPLNVAVRLEL